MSQIQKILESNLPAGKAGIKPKEKQTKLVEAVCQKKISAKEFITFFLSASDIDKGTCADAMKHISESNPEILAPYIDTLLPFINHKLPRVKWGIPEAFGNMSKKYPEGAANAIPYLLKNTTDDKANTTVIKWCAVFALTEIAKNNPQTRKQLLPIFNKYVKGEKNNGIKNVYLKALKAIEKTS
jgi:hypothetical protein